MPDKLLLTFIFFDALFVGGGALILVVALFTKSSISGPQTSKNAATDLLLDECPLSGMKDRTLLNGCI